jgi:hypothetical protein
LVWSKDELNPWPFTLELNTSEKVIGYVWLTPCCDKSLHGYWPCDHEILFFCSVALHYIHVHFKGLFVEK